MERLRTTTCRSCGAEIVFIKTPAGKSMPCDAKLKAFKHKPGGSAKLVLSNGIVVSGELLQSPEESHDYITTPDGYGYTPHWSTCNAPDSFRKRDE